MIEWCMQCKLQKGWFLPFGTKSQVYISQIKKKRMNWLHCANILHCDFKPSNLLVRNFVKSIFFVDINYLVPILMFFKSICAPINSAIRGWYSFDITWTSELNVFNFCSSNCPSFNFGTLTATWTPLQFAFQTVAKAPSPIFSLN